MVAERMCYGLACIVRFPPDARRLDKVDWAATEVVLGGGGRVVGAAERDGALATVFVTPQSAVARFVPPPLPLGALDVVAIRPSRRRSPAGCRSSRRSTATPAGRW